MCMRFVAIMKSKESVIRIDTIHNDGRTRSQCGRAGYDAFLHSFNKEKKDDLSDDLGILGAHMFRNSIEECIDEEGNHNGQRIRRTVCGKGYVPNSTLRTSDGENENTGQLYIILEVDGEEGFETDEIMRQVLAVT